MVKEKIQQFKQHNIITRSISIMILAPLALALIYLGGVSFTLFMMVIATIIFYEWYKIVHNDNFRWIVLGIVYTLIPTVSIVYLRNMDYWGALWLIITVWATDIGAYLCGITFRGPKLCVSISPSKTWSGLIGGIIFAMATTYLLQHKLYTLQLSELLITAVIIALLSQLGDLLESAFKRHFDVKDSGNIIPGHGGILDRVDGFIFAAPFMLFLYY